MNWPDKCEKRHYFYICFAEQIAEGWTRMKIGAATREKRREEGQETRSHKQNFKFLEVENATSEKLYFLAKTCFI